jgi:hypothetical protein
MPDLGAHDYFDCPNPYGLRAADFDNDGHSYRLALRFLGNLSAGDPEDRALSVEGGTPAHMRKWEGSARFRRALNKCRRMATEERAYEAQKAQRGDPWRSPPKRVGMFDPFSRAATAWRERASARDWLNALMGATVDEPETARPGEQTFRPFTDLSPQEAAAAAAQQMPQSAPAEQPPDTAGSDVGVPGEVGFWVQGGQVTALSRVDGGWKAADVHHEGLRQDGVPWR